MAIPVECPVCFRPYKVQDQFAGRSFRCKECDAAVRVPKPVESAIDEDDEFQVASVEDEEIELPVRKRQRSSTAAKRKKSRGRQGNPLSGIADTVPMPYLIGGGLLVSFFLLSLLSQVAGVILSIVVIFVGLAYLLWGALKLLATAFQEDAVCGFMCLLVPLYTPYYVISRWPETTRPFLVGLTGLGMMVSVPLILSGGLSLSSGGTTSTSASSQQSADNPNQVGSDTALGTSTLETDPRFRTPSTAPARFNAPPRFGNNRLGTQPTSPDVELTPELRVVVKQGPRWVGAEVVSVDGSDQATVRLTDSLSDRQITLPKAQIRVSVPASEADPRSLRTFRLPLARPIEPDLIKLEAFAAGEKRLRQHAGYVEKSLRLLTVGRNESVTLKVIRRSDADRDSLISEELMRAGIHVTDNRPSNPSSRRSRTLKITITYKSFQNSAPPEEAARTALSRFVWIVPDSLQVDPSINRIQFVSETIDYDRDAINALRSAGFNITRIQSRTEDKADE